MILPDDFSNDFPDRFVTLVKDDSKPVSFEEYNIETSLTNGLNRNETDLQNQFFTDNVRGAYIRSREIKITNFEHSQLNHRRVCAEIADFNGYPKQCFNQDWKCNGDFSGAAFENNVRSPIIELPALNQSQSCIANLEHFVMKSGKSIWIRRHWKQATRNESVKICESQNNYRLFTPEGTVHYICRTVNSVLWVLMSHNLR